MKKLSRDMLLVLAEEESMYFGKKKPLGSNYSFINKYGELNKRTLNHVCYI